nr:sugar ABC transporter ATP-binding protein [uncultured Microbacterium sp.]
MTEPTPTSGAVEAVVSTAPDRASLSPAIDIRRLNKDFAGTRALNDVSLRVRRGTVHALLGGNGSGKSTTIKILAGVYAADSGDLEIFGKPYDLRALSPATARQAGLRFVHQDLGLFEDLSIEENFALDTGYPRLGPGIDWRGLRHRVRRLLADYEIDVEPQTPIRALRPSDRTMVAIARALQEQDADQQLILVLDEPTARLAAQESELLLDRIRRRAMLGQTVIIVSHRLREVLAVSDDLTIYRDGRVVGELVDESPTEERLVEIMAGKSVAALHPTGEAAHAERPAVFSVTGLRGGPVRGVDFTIHRGEILGLAGLVGSGRSSVLKMIFGEHTPEAGSMTLDGAPFSPSHIGDAMAAGVALVPEDRVGEAAFMDQTISENLAVASLAEKQKRGFMSRAREHADADAVIDEFNVKAAGANALFSSMSGGNQQKVIMARWMKRQPQLLLLDEPTQGVDVMSRADLYAGIRRAAAAGCAIVVASSDLAEIHALCDRTLVLSRGRVSDEIVADRLDVDGLTRLVLREKPVPEASPEHKP